MVLLIQMQMSALFDSNQKYCLGLFDFGWSHGGLPLLPPSRPPPLKEKEEKK